MARPTNEVRELRDKVKRQDDILGTIQMILNAGTLGPLPFDTPGVVAGVWAMRKNLELEHRQFERQGRLLHSARAAFRVLSYVNPDSDEEAHKASRAAAVLGESMAELLSKS